MVSAAPRAVVCVRALQTKFRCFCVQNPPKRFYSSSRVLRGRVYLLRCFFISRSEIPTTRALPSNDDGDERAGVGGATRNPAFRRGFEKKTKVSLFSRVNIQARIPMATASYSQMRRKRKNSKERKWKERVVLHIIKNPLALRRLPAWRPGSRRRTQPGAG